MFHDAATENGKDDGLDAHTLSMYVHAIMACRQISILRARATAIGKALSVEDVNTTGKRRTQTLSTRTTIPLMLF
jgi:hypothetical protein